MQPLIHALAAKHVAARHQAVAGHHQLAADQALELLLDQAALLACHSWGRAGWRWRGGRLGV